MGVLYIWTPALFRKRAKVQFFLLLDLPIIIIKSESNEIRKIPVTLAPFLNLKNIIPSYFLIKKISSVPLFCGLES